MKRTGGSNAKFPSFVIFKFYFRRYDAKEGKKSFKRVKILSGKDFSIQK